MRIDGFVVEQRALCIETHHLTARAETGVDAHDAALSEWRRQQQLLQVGGENADRFFVRLFLARGRKLRLDARAQQTFVGIAGCHFHLFGGSRTAFHIASCHLFRGALIVRRRDRHAQHTLALAAAHRQQAVRGAAF